MFLVTSLCFTATGVMSADVAYLTIPSRSSFAAVLYILPPAIKVSGSLRYLAYAAARAPKAVVGWVLYAVPPKNLCFS